MGEAYVNLVLEWFARFDLLVVDASDPALKRISAPLLLAELEGSKESESAVREQKDRLVAAGYHAQVGVLPGATNVLYEDERGRERILRDGGGWSVHYGAVRWRDAAALREAIEEKPERFSPNVLLRPVVESAAFPTLCYLGGPAEVAYFAQIGCLFQRHGVGMPLVRLRPGATLVEHKVRKVLDKYGLEPDDLAPPLHEVATRYARGEMPAPVADAFEALRNTVDGAFGRLEEASAEIDPTLRGPLASARGRTLREVGHFEKKVLRQLKQRNEIGLRQIGKAKANLYPGGTAQERVVNVASFLATYGPRLFDELLARFAVDEDFAAEDWGGLRCGG